MIDQLTPTERHVANWLLTLRPSEIKELEQFAGCSLFCRDPEVPKLLRVIVAERTHFTEGRLHGERLYRRAFKGDARRYDEAKLRKVFGQVRNLIRLFVAVSRVVDDEMQTGQYVLERLEDADEDFFRTEADALEHAIKKAPASHERLHHAFLRQQRVLEHHSTKRHRIGTEALADLIQMHLRYTRSMESAMACVYENAAQWLQAAHQNQHTADGIQQQSPQSTPPGLPVETDVKDGIIAYLYENIRHMQQPEFADAAAFRVFTAYYQQHTPIINARDREYILRLSVNLCIRKSKEGHTDFATALYDLLQWALAQKDHAPLRWLRTNDGFLNVALAIGQIGNLAEMADFMTRFIVLLPKEAAQYALALGRAYYHFFGEEWTESLRQVNSIDSREPKYMFRKQVLRLCIAYHQGRASYDYEKTHRQVDTFCRYFKRNKVLKKTDKQAYIRLGRFVRQLAMACENPNTDLSKKRLQLEKVLKNPDKPMPVSHIWLQKQITALAP